MFSQVFVCPRGGGVFVQGSIFGGRGHCPGGSLSRGSLSRVSLSQGIFVQVVSVQGDPLWLRAGGTHTTGMRYCFCYLCRSHCSCTGHCSQYTLHTRYHWNTLKCTRWEVTLIKPYRVSCKKLSNNINCHLNFFKFILPKLLWLKGSFANLCSMRKSSDILCLLQGW